MAPTSGYADETTPTCDTGNTSKLVYDDTTYSYRITANRNGSPVQIPALGVFAPESYSESHSTFLGKAIQELDTICEMSDGSPLVYSATPNSNGVIYKVLITKTGFVKHYVDIDKNPHESAYATANTFQKAEKTGNSLIITTRSTDGSILSRTVLIPISNVDAYATDDLFGFDISKTHAEWVTYSIDETQEHEVNLDANGGTFATDTLIGNRRIMNKNAIDKLDDPPTRDGWSLVDWNTKPDGSGESVSSYWSKLADGTTLYAQWEKDSGKPTSVHINCAIGTPVRCGVSTDYANAESTARELTPIFGSNLDWGQLGGIKGVRLDNKGFKARSSCVASGTDTQCFWVSLEENPPATTGNTYVQSPTTGAPDGLNRIGVVSIVLCLIAGIVLLVRRRIV